MLRFFAVLSSMQNKVDASKLLTASDTATSTHLAKIAINLH
ncbi:hypothetical protein [Lysinibacillus sp. fls2-241-R2A-57]|nr:hypothetical protein [Lysinibacillus sp. fls2-241-R2A-57]